MENNAYILKAEQETTAIDTTFYYLLHDGTLTNQGTPDWQGGWVNVAAGTSPQAFVDSVKDAAQNEIDSMWSALADLK